MSITEETGATHQVAPASSFKERLAQRRRELEADTTFELEVPGYDGLWARYRALGYDETRACGRRAEDAVMEMGIEGDVAQAAGERLTAAETLAEACLELLEFKGLDHGKPILASLGYRWTWQAARDLFQVDIPEGVSAKDSLGFVFPYPRDMLMMSHFNEYLERAVGYLPALEEALMGESRAPSGATTSDSLQQRQSPEYP